MVTNNFVTRAGYSFVAICALLSSQFVSGQALEEILVTAQKREQSLQDVPISVATVSGDTILENNYSRLEDLAATAPGLYINETRNGVNVFIRGIGTSDANNSFEQSTSQFSNGLYVALARSSLVSFMDVDRVEVLRGPQPTYFGQNAIGGGVNVISKKPTTEWEGFVNTSYGFEFEDAGVDLAYGGPITDTFRVRLAGRWNDLEGWGTDNTTGQTTNGREGLAYRASAQWQPVEQLVIDANYENLNMDQGIFLFELVGCGAQATPFIASGMNLGTFQQQPCRNLPMGTTDEFVFNQANSHCGTVGLVANPAFMGTQPTNLSARSDLFPCGQRTVDHTQGRFELEYTFDNGVTLNSLTGAYSDRFTRDEDIDKTSYAGFSALIKEVYTYQSTELRLTSPGDEYIDWMTGVYFNDTKDKQTSDLSISTFGVGSMYSGNRFEEEGETKSVFGAITWNVRDDLSFDLGGRYTDVEKKAFRKEQNTSMNMLTINPVFGAGRPNTLDDDPTCVGINFKVSTPCSYAEFNDTDFSYNVGVNYQVPTLDALVYAKYTTGFKAGGHPNAGTDTSSGLLKDFQFGSEKAKSVEIGTKSTWLDGTLEINVNLFHTQIKDVQVSVNDPIKTAANLGNPVNQITNAGAVTTKGVEFEGRWAATDALTATWSAAYTNARYDEYDGALCNQYEIFTSFCTRTTAAGTIAAVGFPAGFKSRAGQKLEYVADIETNIGLAWRTPSIAEGMDLTLSGNTYYNSGYNPSTLYIPDLAQGEYIRLDLRAVLASQADTWSFSVFGNNVTDRIVKTSVKPSARNGPWDAFEVVSQRGAEYGVQFRYNFGDLTQMF